MKHENALRAHCLPACTAALLMPALLLLVACGGATTSTTGTTSTGGQGGTVTPPGAPTLTSASAGDASASLAFTAPASSGSAAITSYTATCVASGLSSTASGAASPLTVTGLSNGTAYSCSVTATSAAGTGAASAALAVTPTGTATPPGAPTLTSASAGDASASLAFTAPASSGSAAITSYTATCVASGLSGTASGAASPLTVTGLTNGTAYSCSVTATSAAGTGAASTALAVTPTAGTSVAAVDPAKLPLGDGRFTRTGPAVGMVYTCYTATGSGGAKVQGPWFNGDGTTWDSLTKISVQGVVHWTSTFAVALGNTLSITGNGLPSTPTGTFPIASTDPAYAYDRNPNSIATATMAWGLPANPTVAASPTCTGLGAIGVLLDGARLFNADDGANRDAVAWEVQDACQGHPQANGQYHHHSISSCLSQKDVAGQHSPLVGHIADGFGIYGNQGENGVPLTNADLDECHGHTHAIMVNGVSVVQYHYHQTKEFPYTIGCFKGKPATLN